MRILIRGAGDLATGIAYRLYKCGFEIIMTETKVPLTVRRTIAFSRAVYEGNAEVEHVTAKLTVGICNWGRTWIYRWKRLPRSSGDYERT